jgi:hypothetical protein
MSDQISWHVELALRPGMFDPFQALTAEMVESTRDEQKIIVTYVVPGK